MAPAGRKALRTPPLRGIRVKPIISYAESSSEDEQDEDMSAEEAEEDLQRSHLNRSQTVGNRQRKIPATPRRASNRQRGPIPSRKRGHPSSGRALDSDGSSASSPKHKKRKQMKRSTLGAPKTRAAASSDSTIIPGGVIPEWQSLPYHIFVQILSYASYPLFAEPSFQPLPSSRWLLSVARMCHAFAEPAYTVLLSTPPLVPMIQAHKLVELMKANPLSMRYKYRQKVESLRIDVGQTVAYSLGSGYGHLDLYGLISELPRLTDLEFYHQMDMPPYRNLDDTIKWTYPEDLFKALEAVSPSADLHRGDKTSHARLRTWRWSSRLGGKTYPIEKIPEVHSYPSFVSLRKVSFVNYQFPSLKAAEEDPKHENILARSLHTLASLEHLVLESSTLANAKLLPLLPKNLRNLELINCWEITADDFAAFLLTHGSHLRVLTLNHNQSLSLAFLPALGVGCPELQVFHMNFTYFNLHATYRDSEPQYDQLLLADQVPVWPSTLQSIEMIQMRKWEKEAAEMFFQSLLDSANNLPDLRKISIQAILNNLGWRDRASFRDHWVPMFDHVFKRVCKPPRVVTSLRSASSKVAIENALEEKKSDLKIPSTLLRTFSRLSQGSIDAPGEPTSQKEETKAGEAFKKLPHLSSSHKQEKQSIQPRRSARASAQASKSVKYAESSDSSDNSAGNEGDAVAYPLEEPKPRRTGLSRELEILKATAGKLSLQETSGSDNEPLVSSTCKGKGIESRQNMCNVVEVRIDNLRPTENQVTEADFLDDERSGDGDWNGEDNENDGYAW